MKKNFLGLTALLALTLGITACGPTSNPTSAPSTPDDGGSTSVYRETYTIAFVVNGERYKTCMVKEGDKITDTIPNPSVDGFKFIGWFEGNTQIDLETYIVTGNATFDARFEAVGADDVLNVDAVKEEGKDYYLVVGWWEVADEADPTKVTSGLTKDSVRLFYGNLIKYLTAVGATKDDIANIQFRNYSTAKVADMGALVNADGDVDILIGVGANVFTTATCLPYNTTDDSKFQTVMGTAEKSRYVALLQGASDLAKTTYDWLDTEIGHKTFLEDVAEDVIKGSLGGDVINLTVNVHGDTTVTTVLDDKDDVITMPTITVPEGSKFVGFTTAIDGEVVLEVAADATLKWADVKHLVAEGATTLDLYAATEALPAVVSDLIVYVQTNGAYLTAPEAALLEARFESTLTDKEVTFVVIEAAATDFTAALGTDADVIIGGNSPLKSYTAHEDGALANAGAKHFVNTSRKVMIPATVNPDHLELAKALYNFVTAEAIAYEIHSTFWTKEYSWVTADEITAIKSGMETYLATLLNVDLANGETFADIFNITFTYYEATNTKVADLGAETLALREGKGTDLIIGCGANVTTTGGVEVADKKPVSLSMIAGNRYVALVKENPILRSVYDNYFIGQEA